MFLSRLARSASSLASASIARASPPRAAAVAAAATAAASAFVLCDQLHEEKPAHALAGHTTLVMSGDCGGTNTRLMVFRIPSGVKASLGKVPEHELVFAKKYLNSSYESFEEVCKLFLEETKTKTGGKLPVACCLACAGGITNNTVSFTNVGKGWVIDGSQLQKSLSIPKVQLINDFEAQGYGLLTLTDDEKIPLNDAKPRLGAPIACVGAGTGLGECFLTCDGDGDYTCWPSEGGHAEFAPRDPITNDLLEFLKVKFESKKRVSVERVISGPGLAAIYEFLRTHWAYEERITAEIDGKFLDAAEHMKGAIVAAGAAAGDVVCGKVVDIFSECYGSEAGNAALKWLPYGGLYISGGIGAKNPDWVKSHHFLKAYSDKGRLSPVVAQVPLYLVTTEDTGERGALFYAVELTNRMGDIDRAGLTTALQSMGKYEGEKQVDDLMSAMDRNGDGRVELGELMDFLEQRK